MRTHDYASGGAYYVTICAQDRRRLFGAAVNGLMVLNEAGRMVARWFRELESKFPDVRCDAFVCMPEHVHFVVRTGEGGHVGADLRVCPHTKEGEHVGSPLRDVVAWFKTMTTNAYIRGVKQFGWVPFPGKLWHRNYYEHIVRDKADLARIRTYIRDNPAHYDVLRYGEPCFMVGNRALLELPKTAYLASRGGMPACEGGRTHRFARTVISGFLSPMERAVFDACLADQTPMIQVLACGLPKTFPSRVRQALDAGRLLIITPFDETAKRVNAARAAWCNQYLLHAADDVVIGHLDPDGMLACLLADMMPDKPIEMPKRGMVRDGGGLV